MSVRTFAGVFAALILTAIGSIACGDTSAPVSQPAPRLEESYQLGKAIYSTSAAVIALDETIKQLHLPMNKLAARAAATRRTELAGYTCAVTVLKRMGAPQVVVEPYSDAVAKLATSLTITKRAMTQTPADPSAQAILSTISEAATISPDENAELIPWLKLSHGVGGLWAYEIGCLIASIRAGIPGDPNNLPLIGTAAALAGASPNGTPPGLAESLSTLGERYKRHLVMLDDLHAVDRAASAVFEAAN